jgi:anti-anti-sigma factor
MKIDVAREHGSARLVLEGRLDREWAEHLSYTIESLLHAGVRSVVLDFAGVSYVSSAAAGVLTRWQRELALLRGSVQVTSLAPAMGQALMAAGWEPGTDSGGTGGARARELRQSTWQAAADVAAFGQYELSPCTPAGTLTCHLHGNPDQLTQAPVGPGDCSVVTLPPDSFALGIGAIGDSYEEARERMGELVAAGGCVTYFPTDGARRADYLLGTGGSVPHAVLATGLSCVGGFKKLIRFNPQPEAEAVPLSELAATGLRSAGGGLAGMVIAGETAGLAGAKLRRSPGSDAAPMRFEAPALREWMSFAHQRTYPKATTLIVGVVARDPEGPIAAQLRPLEDTDGLYGHFHAAVFSYYPLPQRTVELGVLLEGLFAHAELLDVLHLVSDNRGAAGVAESALVRGVAWAGPITQVG